MKSAMVQWIGGVVKDKFEKLVNETGEECEDTEDTFFVEKASTSLVAGFRDFKLKCVENVMTAIVRCMLAV